MPALYTVINTQRGCHSLKKKRKVVGYGQREYQYESRVR